MAILRGLTGVKGDLKAQQVVSVDHAIARIQHRRAVTAAGASGALNIWRDDQRVLRSNFCRYRDTLNETSHKNLGDLLLWLDTWWPELGRGDLVAKGGR